MAVNITRRHKKDTQFVREQVTHIAEDLSEKLSIKHHWQDNILFFHRLGLRGRIEVVDSQVLVDVETDFFIPVTDSWLRNNIEEYLDKYLGENADN